MRFWSSGEVTREASELFRPLRKSVEAEINRCLPTVNLESHWEGWTWSFIAIIMSDQFDERYPERIRKNTRQKFLDFRLKIEHNVFVASSPHEQLNLYFIQLQRSVGLMEKWRMGKRDRETLFEVLKKAETALSDVEISPT